MARSPRSRTRKSDRNGGSTSSHRFFDDMLAMAGSLANSRKDYAADKLESIAQSVRDFSGAMPDLPHFKAYAGVAADSFDGLATYVTQSDLETMMDDARRFASRHPMATLAGAIAAGVIVTQMVQGSSSSSTRAAAAHRSSAARRGPKRGRKSNA